MNRPHDAAKETPPIEKFYGVVKEELKLSPEAVESFLLQLDPAKSAGPGGIHPRILMLIAS